MYATLSVSQSRLMASFGVADRGTAKSCAVGGRLLSPCVLYDPIKAKPGTSTTFDTFTAKTCWVTVLEFTGRCPVPGVESPRYWATTVCRPTGSTVVDACACDVEVLITVPSSLTCACVV